jgi:hypothetical protein
MLSESECRAFTEFEKRGWEKACDPYHHHFGAVTRQSCDALLDAACVQTRSKVLCVQNSAGFPEIRATFQRDSLRRRF